jgi:deoxyribodipyrimidine photo-lyase
MDLVWFKKDLRIEDHDAVYATKRTKKTLFVYVYEEEIIQSPEYDPSHHQFLNECLRELNANLAKRGAGLTVLRGQVPQVFTEIYRVYPFTRLLSYEETGNLISYQRDLRVKDWCKERGIEWKEFQQNGVVRCLKNRDGWSQTWNGRMKRVVKQSPDILNGFVIQENPKFIDSEEFKIGKDQKFERQKGGEEKAWKTLESFIETRGQYYRSQMSSPITAINSCSRLSPYLTYGCISIKTVYQTCKSHLDSLNAKDPGSKFWRQSLGSFMGRLRWHCHFIQKLEDEPDIEFENFNRGFDGIRQDFREDWFYAWQKGETGYPLVDACMRYLYRTGWINFRMRAMLVSFASYHLWLHWRKPAETLARLFLDFEPGIHYSQMQMQSGTTGINAVRIYSPVKQVLDHDPDGIFIRGQIPSLQNVPKEYIAEPHKMPLDQQKMIGCIIGRDYPAPIVEHATAYQEARQKIYSWKSRPEVKEYAKAVYQKHGSRRRPLRLSHAP